jgi:hypothetical protein
VTTQLPIILDRIVLADLERERSVAGHPDVNHTLRVRIAAGIDLVREGGEGLLEWRPVSSNSCTFELEVGDEQLDDLERAALFTGFDKEAVVATFAESACCKPLDVINAELMSASAVRPMRNGRATPRDQGRRQIFRAWFDLPGYQLAFITQLGQGRLSQSAIIEEALVALAQRAQDTEMVGGIPLSAEARSLAGRVLMLSREPLNNVA